MSETLNDGKTEGLAPVGWTGLEVGLSGQRGLNFRNAEVFPLQHRREVGSRF